MAVSSAVTSESMQRTSAAGAVEYVVDIVNVSKSFQRSTRSRSSYTTVKSTLLGMFRGMQKESPARAVTHAIKDLTMRIPRGSSIGLIGRNGSGKSTFLKLVTGIYKPTSGSVTVAGRVAALIELGAGFHPDFTGRENLILAGVMHGLTREQILERFEAIVNFAELEDVIDDPVRTYSSGMFMRLGFSVAVHTDPDILLVDEVLAVGDAGFVAKCKDRIAELRKEGKTLILVTHDLESVERWCDEAIWLHQGEVKDRGYPRRVIDSYRHFIERGEEEAILHTETHSAAAAEKSSASASEHVVESGRWGSREVEITAVEIVGDNAIGKRVYHPNDTMRISISYQLHSEQDDIVFGVGIHRIDGLNVFGTNTEIDRVAIAPYTSNRGSIECAIDRLGLLDGAYVLDVAAHRADGYPYDYHKSVIHFSVRSDNRVVGVLSPQRTWIHNGKEVGRCA
jgi:ABC-type polysaccharide/polyol phosphate transport system ATPase subunit